MMGAQRGFTIIEVMIVLSISAIMLVSASTIFNGRQQATQFSQAVYDLQSKLQGWANEVSSASVPGFQDYTCRANPSGTGPMLYTPGTEPASQDYCIYLGQAIQVLSSGGNVIYSYPVFGLRSVHSGGVDSCQTTCIFPSSSDQASPDLAVNGSGPILISTYNLINGMTITSAKSSSTANENDMLTLYSSLQNSNTSGNEITVSSYQKTFTTQDTATLRSCVQTPASASCGTPPPPKTTYYNNTSWDLCVTDGSRKAKLSVGGSATGITSRIDMSGVGC